MCRGLHGWLDVSIPHVMVWLIFLAADFVSNFAAGPQSHTGAVVLALSPTQVREPAGLARVLPRRDGIVQAGSGAWAFTVWFLSGYVVTTVLI